MRFPEKPDGILDENRGRRKQNCACRHQDCHHVFASGFANETLSSVLDVWARKKRNCHSLLDVWARELSHRAGIKWFMTRA